MSEAHYLRGKTVLVVGATGEVGTQLVQTLQGLGARLGIAVRKPWQVERVNSTLQGEHLVGLVPSTDSEAAAGFVKGVNDSLGPVDSFISTAGAFQSVAVGKDKAQDAYLMQEANLLCISNLARAVIGGMRRRGRGSLVFTGAAAVANPAPGLALYLAAKAALHTYALCLRQEVGKDGVSVCVVAPSTIATKANIQANPEVDQSTWLPISRVVDTLILAASGELGAAGPLFQLMPAG